MSTLSDLLAAYRLLVTNDVSIQVNPDTIDPATVGAIGIDLANLIEPFLEAVNNYDISGGSSLPDDLDGEDLDQYFRINGGVFYVYRKIDGAWVNQLELNLGYTLPDGSLTLRTTIAGYLVTVTLGGWAISNVVYNKLTQTQFTLTPPDANYTRHDLIHANTSGDILKTDGVASISPSYPVIPANSIAVDYAIVPSVSSGNPPYLLYGGGTLENSKLESAKNQADIFPASDPPYILFTNDEDVQIPDNANFNIEITGLDGITMEHVGAVYKESGIRKIGNLPEGDFTLTIYYQ